MAMMAGSVGAMIRDLASSMRGGRKVEVCAEEVEQLKGDIEAILAAKYRNLPPPKVSDVLRANLGLSRAWLDETSHV